MEVLPKAGVVDVFILLLLLVVLLLPKTFEVLLLLPKPEDEFIPNPIELLVVAGVLLNPPKVGAEEVFIAFIALVLEEVVVALKVNPEF